MRKQNASSKAITAPSYLVRQSFGYCVRLIVPHDLRDIVRKRELRYSLRTGFLSEAKIRARRMVTHVQLLFDDVRKGGRMKELTEADIKKLLEGYMKSCLEEAEADRVSASRPINQGYLDEYLEVLSFQTSDHREALALQDYRNIARHVDDLLSEHGLTMNKESMAYKKLCRELLKTKVKLLETEQRHAVGDYSQPEVLSSPLPFGDDHVMTQASAPAKKLSEVIDMYVDDQDTEKAWQEKTREEFLACLNLLKEFIGDVPINSITWETMKEYRKTLLRLPANMRQKRKYRDKTLQDILQMQVDDPMSDTTVNKYMNRASSLFKYAVKRDFMTKNYAEGMQMSTFTLFDGLVCTISDGESRECR